MDDVLKSSDINLTKVCSKCEKILPDEMFGRASGGKYKRSICKPCLAKLGKEVEKLKKFVPKVSENHTCPICKRSESELVEKGRRKVGIWCCDHDHKTGMFRGWLCHQCNMSIGGMKDNIERMKEAIKYLENSEKRSYATLENFI